MPRRRFLTLVSLAACLALLPALPAYARTLTVTVTTDRPAFSPNGDGVADLVQITVAPSSPAAIVADVANAGGAVVRTSLTPSADSLDAFSWDGLDDAGSTVLDGAYTVTASATDPATGLSVTGSAPVVVDTLAPTARLNQVPRVITSAGPVRFPVILRDASNLPLDAILTILDAAGESVGEVDATIAKPGLHMIAWPARVDGRPNPNGMMLAGLSVSDAASNSAIAPTTRSFILQRPVKTTVIRRVDGAGRRVALTFDDCNDADAWSRILDAIATAKIGATFFCAGSSVAKLPDLARRTLSMGISIGNHTWSHLELTKLAALAIDGQLSRDASTWWRVARVTPLPLFRPPFGAYDDTVTREAGARGYNWTVLWDVDPRDWSGISPSEIANRVLAGARGGSIVVLHTKQATADAIGGIIARLQAKGLQPVSVPNLLRAGGLSP